jgi:hypothetical protein
MVACALMLLASWLLTLWVFTIPACLQNNLMDKPLHMPAAGEPVTLRHSRGLLHLLYDLYIRPAPPALKTRLTKELHRLLIGYGEADNFPHLLQELEASERHAAQQQQQQASPKGKQAAAANSGRAAPKDAAVSRPHDSDDSDSGSDNDHVLIDAAEEMLAIAKAASDKAAALLRQTAATAREHAREARRMAILQDLKHRKLSRQQAADTVAQPTTPARPPSVLVPPLSPSDQPRRIPVVDSSSSKPAGASTPAKATAAQPEGVSTTNSQAALDPGHVKVTITPAGASAREPVHVSLATAEGPVTPDTRESHEELAATQAHPASSTQKGNDELQQQHSTPTKSSHPSASSKLPRAPVQGGTHHHAHTSPPAQQGVPEYMQPTESSLAHARAKPRPNEFSSSTTQYLDAADIALDPELSLEVSTLLADAQALLAAAQDRLLEDQAFLQGLGLEEQEGEEEEADQHAQDHRQEQQQGKQAASNDSPRTPRQQRIPVVGTSSNVGTPTYAPPGAPASAKAADSSTFGLSSPQQESGKTQDTTEAQPDHVASTPRYMPGPRLHDGPPEDHGHVPVLPPWLPPGPTTPEAQAVHHHVRPGGTSLTFEAGGAAEAAAAAPPPHHRTARRSLNDQLTSAGAVPPHPQPVPSQPATFQDWYPSPRPLAAASEIQQQLLGREVAQPASSSRALPYLAPHYPSVTRDCLAAHAVQQYIEDPDGTAALGGSSIFVDPLLTPEASFASAAELLQQQSQSTPGYMQPTWSHLLKRSKKYEGGSVLSPSFIDNQQVRKQRGLAPCTPVPLVAERPASSTPKPSKPRTTFREWLAEQRAQKQHQDQQ